MKRREICSSCLVFLLKERGFFWLLLSKSCLTKWKINIFLHSTVDSNAWCVNVCFSLLSGPALHHFDGTTATERHWQRAKHSPNTTATQRAASGSILRNPLWCRACICRLVKQRICVFKDSWSNRSRVMATPTMFWHSTSFFFDKSVQTVLRWTLKLLWCSDSVTNAFALRWTLWD